MVTKMPKHMEQKHMQWVYIKQKEILKLQKWRTLQFYLKKTILHKYEGFDPNSAESYIIFSFLQNTFLEQSLNYASFVET